MYVDVGRYMVRHILVNCVETQSCAWGVQEGVSSQSGMVCFCGGCYTVAKI